MSTAIRTCVGCRETGTRSELHRYIAIAQGDSYLLQLDAKKVAPGRGAWLHTQCQELALKRRAFARALKRETLDCSILAGGSTPVSTETRQKKG